MFIATLKFRSDHEKFLEKKFFPTSFFEIKRDISKTSNFENNHICATPYKYKNDNGVKVIEK